MTPYLRPEAVAEMLGVSLRTIHELARTGRVPHRQYMKRGPLLFVPAEIQAWLDGAALTASSSPTGGRIVRPKGAHA